MPDFDMPPEGASFEARAGRVIQMLMLDLAPLEEVNAAAILGNLGGESGLDPNINEGRPMIPGSRGGFGWEQATGPRRIALEKWAADHDIDVGTDEANYTFLVHELQTTENQSLRLLRNTKTLEAGVASFMMAFERPSRQDAAEVARRMVWARRALAGYKALVGAGAPAPPAPSADPVELQKDVQRALAESGDYRGRIDGIPGVRTLQAMNDYRTRHNL